MNARARKGRDRLERIAALLLSLAVLAERAASRSAPVRFIVLWILRRAEAVAADFVAGTETYEALLDDQWTIAPDRSGHTPADALALALSLRLLALGVQAMAAEAAELPGEASISAYMERLTPITLALTLIAAEVRDTS
jgi:hypothetical protein